MKEPNELIDPWACRQCGESQSWHGRRWDPILKRIHGWVRPTERQLKARMVRRRKSHAAIRWVRRDGRTEYRKWSG